jgi:RNA polymerase sigma factor (sigma-70 family)
VRHEGVVRPVDALDDEIRGQFDRLVCIVGAVCGSRDHAEEAVAEAFARGWERTQRGEPLNNVAGWVVAVALRYTHSRWRRSRAEERATAALAFARPDRPPHDVDQSLDLRKAVRSLPRRQEQVVVLHYLLGYDVNSVASVLGVSPGTVKTALARARTKLATALDVPDGV